MSETDDTVKQNEKVVFSGKLGEVVHIVQPNETVFEKYRRPPGIRLIIVTPEGKLLITKEHRHETNNIDLRLPGGKVCDSLEAFHELLSGNKDILEAAKSAAIKEALEETGMIVNELHLITIANAGATVEWDLYYFLIHNYSSSSKGQQLEQGENIEVTWMNPAELRTAIKAGRMQEWRSVGVLLGMVLPYLQEANDVKKML